MPHSRMYDPTKEGLDIASRFGPSSSTSSSSRIAYNTNQQSTGQPSYTQGITDSRAYPSYTSSNIVPPDVSLPSIKNLASAIGRQAGVNTMSTYGMTTSDGGPLAGGDRNLTWNRSSRQDMGASQQQQQSNQPYYGAGYNGFEQPGGDMMQGQGSRLPPNQGYYGSMAQAESGGPTYYQAHSYSQSQQLPPPLQSTKPVHSDYSYPSQMPPVSTTAHYFQQTQTYPSQAYNADEYYPQNGQSSSGSTLPSARSGGNYHSNSPPIAPGPESQAHKPGLQQPVTERILRTESNEMIGSPELKSVVKKENHEISNSGRKGKGKAAAASDYGDEEDAQKGNGKEGKTSTADFIRRLWTMMQAFSKDGELGEGGKYLDWSESGESFVIKDKHYFEKNILVQHFRHCNFSSFVRQANKYNFKKVKRSKSTKTKTSDGPQAGEEWWEFRHPDFRQDGQVVLEMIKRKAANPRQLRARADAARQEAAQQAGEPAPVVASASTQRQTQDSGQNMNSFGDSMVQQQVQSLMQLNSNLSSRVMDLESQMAGLRDQMKAREEIDRKKEEWFPNLVTFMVKNLTNLNASEGAEQLLNDMNSLRASFDKGNFEPLHLEDLVPPTSLASGNSMDNSKQVPMYTYMSQPTTASSGPIWVADDLSNPSNSAGLMSTGNMATVPVPVPTLNESARLDMAMSIDNNPADQTSGMSGTNYQEANAMMEMAPMDIREDHHEQLDVVPTKEVAPHKRNTLSNWASSLSWTKTPRVLVVEDDAVSRNLAIRFLQLIGCEVDQVTDAESAIAKIKSAPFDVVFMDIILPKMTGHDATKILRASNVTLPIIPMTSSFGDDDRKRYDAHGMTDLLPKPFSRDQLYSMLERHLSHLKAAKRYAINIPPAVGVPPLSDQGVNDALRYSAAHYDEILKSYNNPEDAPMWNPLGGSGTSDAQFIQMVGLQQSLNPDGGPVDFTQMMQTAAGTAVEFTMVPSDAFAAGIGLQMGNTGNKRERENDEEDETSKRARTGPTVTPLN
ncbi:hypothetical protein QFC22_002292 [Naganishia vaughanmartiniae]|uniref:Uncharacterized protein n=1 Tax=Naganishia vaughanmartiniae TaxID=1424756 RepID=A0ACC2XCL3_9TREE|nr:hypothetical protein QFC22_002292 [Naganishia vaughanmartiniae]